MNPTDITIRNAQVSDAEFLAKCIMAGMHLYDFEAQMDADNKQILLRLTDCEQRSEYLYTYINTRVAECGKTVVGALLSYPGNIYKERRQLTFNRLWPDFSHFDTNSDQETQNGEYYLDSLAVMPAFRKQGIGRMLIKDAIAKGISLGYNRMTLVADEDMPNLISFYQSLGFVPAESLQAFGVNFRKMVYNCGF